jgi:hypothetical protein
MMPIRKSDQVLFLISNWKNRQWQEILKKTESPTAIRKLMTVVFEMLIQMMIVIKTYI